MIFDPSRHHRRSLRMRGYDYSAEGAYFVTICTHDRECTLGEVVERRLNLSQIGRIVDERWLAVPNEIPNVEIDEYQIMPDHFHGIVVLWDKSAVVVDEDAERYLINQIPLCSQSPPSSQKSPENRIFLGLSSTKFSEEIDWPLMKNPRQTLGKVIRHFKAKATKSVHDGGFNDFEWQKGYYDHIIRDEADLQRVRLYIRNNPRRWSESHR